MATPAELMAAGLPAAAARALGTESVTGATATGTAQSDAYPLVAAATSFSTVPASSGARLPGAGNRTAFAVTNSAANVLLVYPAIGQAINAETANAAVDIPPGYTGYFIPSGIRWVFFSARSSASALTDGAGTPGTNVTASETTQDGISFTTILTLTGVAATIGDGAALAGGALIYTLPAGALIVNSASMSVGLTLTTGTPTTDTPELGIGTTIGDGAVATLGDVDAAAENILGPATANDIAGTAEALTQAKNLVIEAADDHTVHFNYADTWADVDDTVATLDGTVVLRWTKMPLA